MTKSVLNVLTDARAKIARPEWWSKGNFHSDETNRFWFKKDDPRATCHCILGAVEIADPKFNPMDMDANGDYVKSHPAVAALAAAIPQGWTCCNGEKTNWIPSFNDDRNTTHEQVLALFDTAIAAEAAKH